MKFKTNMQKGFTLIELMITVAIVGILAAVALPAYQDYTIRAQVTEGVSLASGAKAAVAEYHSNKGEFPADNAEAGLTATGAAGKFVTGVVVADGVITATFGNDANANITGNTIILTPTENAAGNLAWSCGSDMVGTDEEKYLPSSCRDAASDAGGDGN